MGRVAEFHLSICFWLRSTTQTRIYERGKRGRRGKGVRIIVTVLYGTVWVGTVASSDYDMIWSLELDRRCCCC